MKKLIGICSALAIVAAGGAIVFGARDSKKAKEARASNDIGIVTVSEVRNAISTSTAMYLLPTQNYSLPDSWDYGYVGVGDNDGVFVNGVKLAGAALKYAGTGSAYITFYFGLPNPAVEGDVVEFKGTFESAASGCSFSMNYTAQRFAETWIHGLERYDTVSLADANLPDISNVAVNTDDFDKSGLDTSYVSDPAGLPKKSGYFGLTNDTGSYAFQFNHTKTATNTGWAHVLIGGQGPLWAAGHFIDFGFLDAWATTGHAQIKEMKGNGNNWAADELHATGAIALNWNEGATNLLEMGAIKVKDSGQHFVFFKVNGALKFGEYWTLDSEAGGMTTKVTLQYAGTDATFANSIQPASVKISPSTYVSAKRQLYVNLENDICPAVNNWADYFISCDGNGLKLNGNNIGVGNWNYFKKTGSKQMFLALGDIGVTPVSGDILYFGGMFKAAREVNGVKTLFKINFAETYFEYDGESWHVVNPNYEAGDFAKDLLKLTRPVCSAAQSGNHDALASVWAVLADGDHYAALVMAEKDIIKLGTPDNTIVVPSTDAEIDEMLPEDAIDAALYRYDYCDAKYSLGNFIGRTITVSFSSNILNTVENDSNAMMIVIIVTSVMSISVIGILLAKKRQIRVNK